METILLTGAGGFVGRHVAAALAGRARVVTPRENATGRRIDLLDAGARRALIEAERPDTVVHLAWMTEHGRFWAAPENAVWEAASLDLFGRAFAVGARRIVGAGSCAEYDWTTGAAAFAEDAPLRPGTAYGAAKVRTAEGLANMTPQGASWAWGRIFFLFGPGEPAGRLIPSMLRAALAREPIAIGPPGTVRDFWDVRNAGAALAALATSEVQGPVNIASGRPTAFGKLARLVERLAGAEGIITAGGRALSPGEPVRLVADATRLRHEVGVAAEIGLEQGLAAYIAALRRETSGIPAAGRHPRESEGRVVPGDPRFRGNDG